MNIEWPSIKIDHANGAIGSLPFVKMCYDLKGSPLTQIDINEILQEYKAQSDVLYKEYLKAKSNEMD